MYHFLDSVAPFVEDEKFGVLAKSADTNVRALALKQVASRQREVTKAYDEIKVLHKAGKLGTSHGVEEDEEERGWGIDQLVALLSETFTKPASASWSHWLMA